MDVIACVHAEGGARAVGGVHRHRIYGWLRRGDGGSEPLIDSRAPFWERPVAPPAVASALRVCACVCGVGWCKLLMIGSLKEPHVLIFLCVSRSPARVRVCFFLFFSFLFFSQLLDSTPVWIFLLLASLFPCTMHLFACLLHVWAIFYASGCQVTPSERSEAVARNSRLFAA